jgi:hypothetical protein
MTIHERQLMEVEFNRIAQGLSASAGVTTETEETNGIPLSGLGLREKHHHPVRRQLQGLARHSGPTKANNSISDY